MRSGGHGLGLAIVLLLASLFYHFIYQGRGTSSHTAPGTYASGTEPGKGEVLEGRVVRVHDGDTLTVLHGRTEVKVRLFGIDAPETNPAQDYGQRAKQLASELAFGKDVRVLVADKDRYGRTVGEVIIVDGEREVCVNAALVDAGLAWAYRQYSGKFIPLEESARKARRGLWADPDPTPPWEFRKQHKAE